MHSILEFDSQKMSETYKIRNFGWLLIIYISGLCLNFSVQRKLLTQMDYSIHEQAGMSNNIKVHLDTSVFIAYFNSLSLFPGLAKQGVWYLHSYQPRALRLTFFTAPTFINHGGPLKRPWILENFSYIEILIGFSNMAISFTMDWYDSLVDVATVPKEFQIKSNIHGNFIQCSIFLTLRVL